MNISDVLHKDAILVNLESRDKKGVLEELSLPVSKATGIQHKDLVRVLMERERLGSTGIGDGVGIPHGKLKALDRLILGFGLSRKGVDFDSMDKRPTHIFFLLFTPENSTGPHLKLLAKIAKLLKNTPFKERLMQALEKDEIFELIRAEDEA
jgi:PTS system nitrogen regulatory IIA component